MSRWRAFSIHLLISLAVFGAALLLMLRLWYPHPYFEAIGGSGLLRILVGVDVVLGPLITLVVFKAGKKGLKLDLTLIACAQLVALTYGLWVMAIARPVFVVFAVDRFNVISAQEVDFSQARPPFDHLSWTGPVLVAAQLPVGAAAQALLFSAAMGGADVQNLARYYRPYAEQALAAVAKARPLADLASRHPESADEIREFLKRHALPEELAVYLPLSARLRSMAMVLDRRSGAVLGALPIDPW